MVWGWKGCFRAIGLQKYRKPSRKPEERIEKEVRIKITSEKQGNNTSHSNNSSKTERREEIFKIDASIDLLHGLFITFSKSIELENLESRAKLKEFIDTFSANFPNFSITPHFSSGKGEKDKVEITQVFCPGLFLPNFEENQKEFFEIVESMVPKIQEKSLEDIESKLRGLEVSTEDNSNEFFNPSTVHYL